jgi:hypothetical protein
VLPGRARGVIAIVLLAVGILIDLASIGFEGVRLHGMAAKPAGAGKAAAVEDEDLAELLANPTVCVQPVIYIATVVVFCLWIYRAYKNLSLLGVSGLRYSAGWAVGSFFVPILNLYRPCQIAQEMWRASDPDTPAEEPRAWRQASGSAVIGFWWGFWLISNVVQNVAFRMNMSGQGGSEARVIGMAGDGLSIVAALFAILMIKKVRDRQVARYERAW